MQPPTQDSRSNPERFFAWFENLLKERKTSGSQFQKIFRSFRKGLTIATISYFLFLIVLLSLLGRWGERNWILSILLFVPAGLWLAPLALLTPLHLIVRPKLCWITFLAFLLIAFIYLDFCWSFSRAQNGPGLTVLTNNIGQRKFRTLATFIEKENPDVVALQEAWRAASGLSKQYPERFVANQAEYILVSRFPIRNSGLLSELAFRGRPIGSWFELEYEGQSIVVYNIHMPTPRQELGKLRGRGFIVELFTGKGIYSDEMRKSYAEFIELKSELAHGLIKVLEQEKRPFLVVGDFNMPSNGYIWDLFRSKLTDAFGAKGCGYGSTFPGESRNPLSFFGPWLRLDYLFAGKNWQPIFCRVEPRQPAQHRAVVARFTLQNPK